MRDLQQSYLKFLHDKPKGFFPKGLFAFLRFLSYFFLTGWWIKKISYRSGVIPRKRLTCPVVSVGNLTTGGTGKTPIVIALAGYFCGQGKRVAVLSRGYGRIRREPSILWVSDGKSLLPRRRKRETSRS